MLEILTNAVTDTDLGLEGTMVYAFERILGTAELSPPPMTHAELESERQ
jgi:hypothetical protein